MSQDAIRALRGCPDCASEEAAIYMKKVNMRPREPKTAQPGRELEIAADADCEGFADDEVCEELEVCDDETVEKRDGGEVVTKVVAVVEGDDCVTVTTEVTSLGGGFATVDGTGKPEVSLGTGSAKEPVIPSSLFGH